MSDRVFTGRYRTRRGWFGKAILQKLYSSPLMPMASDIRKLEWEDVPFCQAPAELNSISPDFAERMGNIEDRFHSINESMLEQLKRLESK